MPAPFIFVAPNRLKPGAFEAERHRVEWLRRERRRLDARKQLRTAYELFTEFGLEAFADRARIQRSRRVVRNVFSHGLGVT